MLMSTKAVAMKIGPMSGGDMNTMKALLNSLNVSYVEKSGYLETLPVSPGDQDPILQKCVALQLGYEPLGGDTSALQTALAEANTKAAEAEKREQAALQRADVADKEAARFRGVAYPLKESLNALMELK